MKLKFIILLLGMFWCMTAVDDAAAQTRFGVRGGIYLDQDEPFAGAHFIHPIQRHWIFNPNFEYVFVETGSMFTINADLHYDLPSRSSTTLWLGGGLGISRFSSEEFENTDAGLNLLMGASFGRGPAIPFLQVKLMLMDESQLVLGGGVTF